MSYANVQMVNYVHGNLNTYILYRLIYTKLYVDIKGSFNLCGK